MVKQNEKNGAKKFKKTKKNSLTYGLIYDNIDKYECKNMLLHRVKHAMKREVAT